MNTTATYFRIGLTAVVFLAAGLHVQADDERTKLDCGVNALFLLHRLEGRPVAVEQLLSKLPAHNPEGYSMAELAAASEALGLGLEGVRFAKGDPHPDRPAIAFVKNARGGHFTVLRPVGTRGTMVQVIDPPAPPWVTDYDRLFIDGLWTNRILIPRPPWYSPARATGRMAIAGMMIVAASSAWGWSRSSQARRFRRR
ncbi:MAG: cysteine peptidase family C39 domain-containing protein [Paludisphaera borealis]|uniref:cysteine peptidase family C39 domain-containing protein n=1 Tax=Paludisphaera borealis TaxID=1387353 RepID=UPI002847E551|nr:cysteine peptidase family C39 domain-containing protein [Paludisphaera borealis]MDR3623391.1 cysteine peptidase family C39 domain-containing protein [Paludisphaera borealis]